MRRGLKKWCELPAHGGTVKVFVSKAPIFDDDGNQLDAQYDHAAHTITIEWKPDVNQMKSALVHESFHMAFAGYSADAITAALGKGWEDREERVISFLEPVWFASMSQFLRLPKPPRFE